MSHTGVFTKLTTKDGSYPKVLDMDGLKASLIEIGMEHFLKKSNPILIMQEVTDKEKYPHETYFVIEEFRTWKRSTVSLPNIERCGMGYDGGDSLTLLLEKISENTEDFVVLHSGHENDFGFPNKIDKDGKLGFYEIHCSKGKIKIYSKCMVLESEEVIEYETKDD
jgi:hypothetical protein